MNDDIAMIALKKGTIVGARGILHVDPANGREGGRYSHPVVSASDAALLERRGLARRADAAVPAADVRLVDTDGSITSIDNPGAVVLGGNGDAAAAPEDVAVTGHAGDDLGGTGLSEDDPDAPPVAPRRRGRLPAN